VGLHNGNRGLHYFPLKLQKELNSIQCKLRNMFLVLLFLFHFTFSIYFYSLKTLSPSVSNYLFSWIFKSKGHGAKKEVCFVHEILVFHFFPPFLFVHGFA
jgi:hypothetical protein